MVTPYVGQGFLNVDVIDNEQTLNTTFYSNDGTVKDRFYITKGGSSAAAPDIDEML